MSSEKTYFAEIDKDGTVLRVLVASAECIKGMPGTWLQTWKRPQPGVTRKNFAAVGGRYDADRDAFVVERPNEDATFNEATCRWESKTLISPKEEP